MSAAGVDTLGPEGAMKFRWPLVAALVAAAAAAAWLAFGTRRPAPEPAGESGSRAGGAGEGASRPGLAAAKPPSAAVGPGRSGRCEISGTVRREGEPVPARLAARRAPH